MAKQREPLDIEAAFADDVPASIPTGDGETVVRAPLDLSELVPAEGSESESTIKAPSGRPAGVPDDAVDQGEGLWMWHEGSREDPSSVRQAYIPSTDKAIGDNISEIIPSAVGGVQKAGVELAKTAADITIPLVTRPFGEAGDKMAAKAHAVVDSVAAELQPTAPQTTTGNITQGISQFTAGMFGYAKALKALNLLQKVGKGTTIARGMVEGAATDATVFDPTEERLSNLVEEHPSLSNPITEYLAAKPEDSRAEGRFKNAVEGLMLGTAVEGLMSSLRGIKRVRKAKAAGGTEAAAKEMEAVADELENPSLFPTEYRHTGEPPTPQEMEFLRAEAKKAGIEKPDPEALDMLLAEHRNPTKGGDESGQAALMNLTRGIKEEAAKVAPKVIDSTTQEVDDIIAAVKNGSDDTIGEHWNLEKVQASGGMKATLETTAAQLAPKIKGLKVQTWDETVALADQMGLKKSELMERLGELGKGVEEQSALVLTARKAQNSIAKQIEVEARKIDGGTVTDRTRINALIGELKEVESALLPVRLAQARGTRQWGIIADDVFSGQQIKAIIASGGDPSVVTKLVRGPGTLGRMVGAHNEYWINALLSGPKTHLVNMTSNTLNTLARPVNKMAGGSVREGLHEFMGLAMSIKDSIGMAAKSFRLEESILDPHNLKSEAPRFGISSGNAKLNPKSFMGAATDWLGKAVRLPTRFLMAEDEFFKQLNYRANVYSKSTREGIEKGLDGKQLAEYVESRFQSAFDGTGKGMDDAALHEARVATFTEDLDPKSFIGGANTLAIKHPGVRLVVPFIRTPTNIIRQLGQQTPGINLLMKSYREDLKAGGGRAAAARGKMATGGLLWSGAILLSANEKLTGRGPRDSNERAALLATGWRPYSYKTDDGTYLDYSRLDPFGMALGLAADFTETSGYLDDNQKQNMASAMMAALGRNLTSKTYLRGISEALEAMNEDKAFEHWMQSRAGSYVPSGAKQIADLFPGADDTMREVRSMMDAVYARTPGLSDNLPPKRDLLGEPIRYPPGLGPDSVSPFGMSKGLKDPVRDELARLSYGFTKRSNMVGNVDLTKFKNAKGQDAFDRVQELTSIERKGRYTMAERLSALIESDRYQDLPDGNDQYDSKKLQKVREIIGEYHIVTLKRLRKEFPEVDAAIRTDQKNAKVVPRKGLEALAPILGQ